MLTGLVGLSFVTVAILWGILPGFRALVHGAHAFRALLEIAMAGASVYLGVYMVFESLRASRTRLPKEELIDDSPSTSGTF